MPKDYYSADKEQVRSFIAVELPQAVKEGLATLQKELKLAGHTAVKWVAPEGIHLTLKFLGNVSTTKISGIVGALERVAAEFSAFRLEISGLGAFPNLKRPRVLWVGVGGQTEKLISLQQLIDKALIPQGFSPEQRPFSPHLTLARLRENALPRDRQSFGELLQKTPFTAKYEIEVDSISLMWSQLFPAGAVYTRLAWIAFRQSTKAESS